MDLEESKSLVLDTAVPRHFLYCLSFPLASLVYLGMHISSFPNACSLLGKPRELRERWLANVKLCMGKEIM